MAVSPDGMRLFVALRGADVGWVEVYDTLRLVSLLARPIVVGNGPTGLCLTPDGLWALVANTSSGTISRLDASRLRLERTIPLPKVNNESVRPALLAIAPDGVRAFVGNLSDQSVQVINLADGTLAESLPLGESGRSGLDLGITPSGDRLYVALGQLFSGGPVTTGTFAGLAYVPLGHQRPEDWNLTQGFVSPLDYQDPNHLAALLGPASPHELELRPSRPSSLSQVVSATGGCTYDFEFWGIGTVFEAVAEVIWRGSDCGTARTDSLPIEMLDLQVGFSNTTGDIGNVQAFNSALFVLKLHRARLEAPAGAEQAEIRFLVPPSKNAIIDTVSFQASNDPVANADLMNVADGVLVGWNLAPASAAAPTLIPSGSEVQIANNSAQSESLFQTFAVTPAQPFELELRGRIAHQLASAGAPQLELRWFNPDGVEAQPATILTISASDEQHRLSGTVPVATTQAELHIVIPSGVSLGVERIAFTPVELISVPVEFIAQAPGELTVEHFGVTYQVGAPTRPPVPELGLCQATPPAGGHGKPGSGCGWCDSPCEACSPSTPPSGSSGPAAPGPIQVHPQGPVIGGAKPAGPQTVRALTPMRRVVLRSAQPAAVLREPALMAERPPLLPIEADIAAVMPATDAAWAILAGDLASTSLPLTVINGIANDRAETLHRLNITNVPELAAADPARLVEVRGISPRLADDFIAQAAALLAAPENLPIPLISCLMPTFNRRKFVPQAIEYFRRQDYPRRELIILDDGDDPVADLIPDDENIHYLRLVGRQTVGAKRNRGAQEAAGALLANWDDDVWIAPWRLRYQAAALLQRQADLVGIAEMLHYEPASNRAWHSARPTGGRTWMSGATFLYRKSFWERHPYPNSQPGSDIAFLRADPNVVPATLQAVDWIVDILHGENVSPKAVNSPWWVPIPAEEIQKLLGEDWTFYEELAASEKLNERVSNT